MIRLTMLQPFIVRQSRQVFKPILSGKSHRLSRFVGH